MCTCLESTLHSCKKLSAHQGCFRWLCKATSCGLTKPHRGSFLAQHLWSLPQADSVGKNQPYTNIHFLDPLSSHFFTPFDQCRPVVQVSVTLVGSDGVHCKGSFSLITCVHACTCTHTRRLTHTRDSSTHLPTDFYFLSSVSAIRLKCQCVSLCGC